VRRVLVATAVACVGLIGAESAMACSCATEPVKQQLADADAAVVAKLVDADRLSADQFKLRYRVKRVVKGAPGLDRGESLTLRSHALKASCGLPRRKDRAYGLLLDRRKKRLTASLCSVVSPKRLRSAASGKAKGKICGRA
jgi:hypothetical protein